MAAARTKVQRLERSTEAFGDNESTEAKWLAYVLKEARRAGHERPTASQLEVIVKRSFNDLRIDCCGWSRIESTKRARRSHGSVDQVLRRETEWRLQSHRQCFQIFR